MKYFRLIITLVVSVILLASGATACSSKPKMQQWPAPPAMQIDTSKTYTAIFDTSLGSFTVTLFTAQAPKTVNNFVFLAQQKFYNGTIFHRIIQTFMIQGGDPTGTGMGTPGYNIPDELPISQPYAPDIVAMANTGHPNSGGSQFFICTGADAASLNNTPIYTQFGQVTQGMDVVQKIAAVPVTYSASGELSKPKNPPVIKTITIQVS